MISVIVPVYKVEKYLDRCVTSILTQTYKDIELILVDDGSPDNCPQICDMYAAMDERVKVIHKKNGGVSTARNAGLEVANGEYIAFVDSDDYIEPNMYEKMMEKAVEYTCDVIMCDCKKDYAEESNLYTHNIRGGFYSKEQLIEEYYPQLLMLENIEYPATISNWTLLWKSSLNTDNMRYAPGVRFSEDLLFGAKLLKKANSFYYMKGEALYHYVFNSSSASHTFSPDKWESYKRLHAFIKKEFLNNQEYDFDNQVDLCLLFFVYNTIKDILFSDYTVRQKKKSINEILDSTDVMKLFKELRIRKLKISKKLKIVTYIYKYRVGLYFLIKYYGGWKNA